MIRCCQFRWVHVALFLCYVGLWTGYVIGVQWSQYVNRRYPTVDTGLVADLIYRSTVYGEFLSSPIVEGSHLFRHVNPTILLMAPCLWLSPSSWGLIWGNVVVVALGAIPCALLSWRIARRFLVVHVVVAWYLTNRMLIVNLHFPHFELLFCPLILWMIYAAYGRRWILYIIMLLLTLGVRADVGLPLAVFGIWVAIRRHRLMGLITSGVSLAVPVVLALWLMPKLDHPEASAYLWKEYGATWTEIFIHWGAHPINTCRRLLDSGVPSLFAATGGLLLLSPTASLITVASTFLEAMSDIDWRRSLGNYNSAAAIPWMVWGLSLGVRRVLAWWCVSRPHLSCILYRIGLGTIVIAVSAVPATTIYGMFRRHERPPVHQRMVPAWNIPDRNRRIFEYLRSELPPGAPVAAQMDLYTLVPYRRGLTTLRHAAQARYVIVDRYGRSELSPDEVDSLLTRLLSSKSHCLKHEDDGFYVFESMAHSQASP